MTLLSAPARRQASRFARPSLEALEDRYAPAALSIGITYGLGRNITVHGTLTQTSTPGNQLITIVGAANGQVTTDANGHYSYNATPAHLGSINAQKTDGSSNIASTNLTDQPPLITAFDAIENAGGMWLFRGTVTYHRPFESMTIYIDGSPLSINLTQIQATSTGQFSWAKQLDGTFSDNGTVWAKAISPWGLESNQALDTVHQTGT